MNSLPSTEPIWVGMRLRPLVNHEKGEKHCLSIKDNVVTIELEDVESKRFAFDVAMDSTDASSPNYVSQAKCYDIMGKRMLKQMLQGYNTCLFCYGQTGTGKTTTIMGKAHPPAEQGLLMRLIRDIFEEVRKQKESGSEVYLVVQMLEVYNERLHDLLATPTMSYNGQKKKIDVHVHPELGVYLTGAEDCPVQSAEECLQLIEYGNTMKAVSSTAMNASSSRGHTVFKLSMEKKGGSDNLTTRSEVCFADLAGRENERTTQVTGERLAELSFINRSLMWLATCIQSLGGVGSGEGGRHGMRRKTIAAITPASGERKKDMSRFRNSKLTLLLSNALSGNSRTAMIGTLSPAAGNFEESLSTLRFASTVKSIKLEAKAATAIDKDSLLKKLEDEVKTLRSQLEKAREKEDVEDISDIRSKIEATTAIAAVQARDWDKFQKEAADVSKRRSLTLERLTSFASSYMGSHALPYLANYSEDPHLAFKLVLHVPPDEQERTVGSGQGNDFRLPPSLGISHVTAYVRNSGGRLLLRAAFIPQSTLSRRQASIEVNAEKLQQDEIELSHLDCILFGRSTVFYVFMQPTAPEELAKVVSRRSLEEDQGNGASATQIQQLTSQIIGEERSMDPLESQLAKEYCNQLQSLHLDSEGNAVLRAFMLAARRAKLKVDEANEITESVRPGEGLSFELVAVAPVLSYGYPGTGNLPELSVRLVRHHRRSASRLRWDLLAAQRKTYTVEGVVRNALSISKEKPSVIELLLTWSWPKFMSRLEIMHEVREVWIAADPDNFTLDPMKDPWKEHGPSELEELCQEHDQKVQELRERARSREKELEETSGASELQRLREELELSKTRELATAAEVQRLRKELEATKKAQSKTLITCDEEVRSTSAPILTPKAIASAYQNGSSVAKLLQEADAKDRVSRCLELSRANKALLESLSSEQIYGQ